MSDDGISVTLTLKDEFTDSASRVSKAVETMKHSFSEIVEQSKAIKKSFGDELQGVFDTTAKYAGYVGTALVGAFGLMAREVLHQSEELVHLNEITGISVERLQELGLAAQANGSSLEGMAQGMRRLSMLATSASEGSSRAEAAFRKLGVSVYDSNGNLKETGDLFNEVADGFSKLEGHTEKSALAMQLFGRAGQNLLPVLEKGTAGFDAYGKAGRDLGIIMSKEAVEASSKLEHELGLLTQAGKSLVAEALAKLEEHLPDVIDFMIKLAIGINAAKQGFKDMLTDFGAGGDVIVGLATNLKEAWKMMKGDMSGLDNVKSIGTLWDEASKKISEGHKQNAKDFEEDKLLLDSLNVKLKTAISTVRGLGDAGKDAAKGIKEIVDPTIAVLDAQYRTLDTYQKTGNAAEMYKENVKDAQKALEDYARKLPPWIQLTKDQRDALAELREGFEHAKKVEEDYTKGEQEAKRQSEEFGHMLKEGAVLADKFGFALSEWDLANIAEDAQNLGMSMSEMFRVMEEAKNSTFFGGLDSALREFGKKMADMKGLFLGFFNSIESGMSKAFENLLESGGKWRDAMKGFFDDLKKSFYKMISDMLARELMSQVFGAGIGLGGFGAGGGGGSQSPYSAAGGGGGGGGLGGAGGLLSGLVGGAASLFGAGGGSGLSVDSPDAAYLSEIGAGGGESGLSLGGLGTGLGVAAMGAGLASQGIKNGNVTQSTLGGAISGAALGATIGSIIPGIGTVIGGVVGFVAGAAMGFISGRRKKRKRKAQKRAAAAAAAAQAAYENDLARELIKEDVIGKYGGGNALEGEVDTISGLMSGDVSDEELAKLGGAQQIIANAQGIKSQSGINATNNRTVNVGAPVINVSVGSIGDNYETAQLAQDLGYHLVNTINAAGAGV